MRVGGFRAVAALLLTGEEEQPNILLLLMQPQRSSGHCGNDPFCVTRSASVDFLVVFARSDEWWHSVEMRRKIGFWRWRRRKGREDVEAALLQRHALHAHSRCGQLTRKQLSAS